jgi:hypothetical protein
LWLWDPGPVPGEGEEGEWSRIKLRFDVGGPTEAASLEYKQVVPFANHTTDYPLRNQGKIVNETSEKIVCYLPNEYYDRKKQFFNIEYTVCP